MFNGITYGKFSRADSKGIYASGCTSEERLIATWQPDEDIFWAVGEDGVEELVGSNFIKDNYTCVPHAECLEKFEDGYVIKLVGSNVRLHVSA